MANHVIKTDTCSFEIKEFDNGLATITCWSYPDTVYAQQYLISKGYKHNTSVRKETYPANFGKTFIFFMDVPEDGSSLIPVEKQDPKPSEAVKADPLAEIPSMTKEAPKKPAQRKKAPAKKAPSKEAVIEAKSKE